MSAVCRLDVDSQKLVIFSDTHLSDRFDQAQFEFIQGAIATADQVIINGDFWDHYEASFERFINSPWQQLFPLLKQKKTIYIHGNHDEVELVDERVNLFSNQQVSSCVVKAGHCVLKIKHGHQAVPSWDVKYPWLFKNRLMLRWGNILQRVGVKIWGEGFLRVIFTYWNWIAKKQARQLQAHEVLVCGHTHLAELNLAQHYINTGVIRWGLGQYLVVDGGGRLKLVKSKY